VERLETATKRRTILIAEDEALLRDSLKIVLEGQGYDVTTAADGKMACEILATQDFDCVLTDVKMPRLSGLGLVKYAKEFRPELPVVVMSGFSGLSETKEANEMGVAGFIPKPFRKAELRALLDQVIQPDVQAPAQAQVEPTSVKNLASAIYSYDMMIKGLFNI
jgi:two-component system response regulator PilR (NtrC family)